MSPFFKIQCVLLLTLWIFNDVNAVDVTNCVEYEGDPCLSENHNILDDYTRSTAYYNPEEPFLSDKNLSPGWYRSVSQAGDEMPKTSPVTNGRACQSKRSVYLQKRLQKVGEIEKWRGCAKAYAKKFCKKTYAICLKKCASFTVYYLPQMVANVDRYCFGSEAPCDPTEQPPVKFTPNCEDDGGSVTGPACLSPANDPCDSENHEELNDYTRSSKYRDANGFLNDFNLIPGWYRSTSPAGGNIPEEVDEYYCKSSAPMYLSEKLSKGSGDIETWRVCAKTMEDDCERNYTICRKRCDNFKVYYLVTPEGSSDRYCFGSETPCDPTENQPIKFTPDCEDEEEPEDSACPLPDSDICESGNYMELNDHTRSSNYMDATEFLNDYNLIPGWYRSISPAGGDIPTRVQPYHCKSSVPMYLSEKLSEGSEDTETWRVCTMEIDNNCTRSYTICRKECDDFNLYYLVTPEGSSDRYCFGTEVPCDSAEEPPVKFTPNCDDDLEQSPCPLEDADICESGSYTELNDITRSSTYRNGSSPLLHDYNLIPGWYRSISPAGGDIPMSVDAFYCQSSVPMYLSNKLPESTEDMEVWKVCARTFDDECARDYTICRKECDGFNLYYLVTPEGSSDRYCFGTEKPCDDPEQGFTPNCGDENESEEIQISVSIKTKLDFYENIEDPTDTTIETEHISWLHELEDPISGPDVIMNHKCNQQGVVQVLPPPEAAKVTVYMKMSSANGFAFHIGDDIQNYGDGYVSESSQGWAAEITSNDNELCIYQNSAWNDDDNAAAGYICLPDYFKGAGDITWILEIFKSEGNPNEYSPTRVKISTDPPIQGSSLDMTNLPMFKFDELFVGVNRFVAGSNIGAGVCAVGVKFENAMPSK